MTGIRLLCAALVCACVLAACGGSSGGSTQSNGTVAFTSGSASVVQSAGKAMLSAARGGDARASATVNYATQDGSAVAGIDYTATTGTLSWNAGDSTAQQISVPLNTVAFAGTKTFTVVLSGESGIALGTPSSITVTITGSAAAANPGAIALTAGSDSVAESAGNVTVTVSRTDGSSGAATISYATQDASAVAGTNYTSTSGTLSWASGDASNKSFSVPLSATSFSGTKAFNVVLSNPSGASLGSPSTAVVSITGSGAPPAPGTIALSASSDSVAQGAGGVTITVTRTGGSSAAASVHYATQNGTAVAGTNYTSASGSLSWASGDATSKSFAVTVNTTAFSGSKTFTVTLSSASGATLGSPATATVTITGGAASQGPAANLAAKLGAPSRLLLGIGEQSSGDPIQALKTQGISIDIYTRYLGGGDWTTWNSPPCDYVCVVTEAADSVSAIPMFTQYEMANDGDGNISVINDSSFMSSYWTRARQMYQDLGSYGKPALVNLEPDFWGYAEQNSPNGDPTQLAAVVSSNPDCSTLPNNVTGLAECLIAMARKYAPKTYVGFPLSTWGGNSDSDVIAFMNALGAQNADFVVEETLDRDAGCFEVSPQPAYCSRGGSGWYWDETNQTHPNFQDHLTQAEAYHTGIGNLPLIWWQTPEGVPSSTPGGTDYHYRDDRVDYFLKHPTQLTAVGGLAVVFSCGEGHQTDITTDGGQFEQLSSQYYQHPAPLP